MSPLVRKLLIKYIIIIVVHFVGYSYIMDLIKALWMERIKIPHLFFSRYPVHRKFVMEWLLMMVNDHCWFVVSTRCQP
jgi:hypothetical protein